MHDFDLDIWLVEANAIGVLQPSFPTISSIHGGTYVHGEQELTALLAVLGSALLKGGAVAGSTVTATVATCSQQGLVGMAPIAHLTVTAEGTADADPALVLETLYTSGVTEDACQCSVHGDKLVLLVAYLDDHPTANPLAVVTALCSDIGLEVREVDHA